MSGKFPPAAPGSALKAEFAAALALQRRGRIAEAERACQAILMREPKHFDAGLLLGLIFLHTGRCEAAERRFGAAIALRPDSAPAHSNRALALHELRRPEESLAAFDRAIALKPNAADVLYNRAIVLQGMGRLDAALGDYDRALALNPNYAVLNNRGNVLNDLERFDEALASYDRAIALMPDAANAWYNRGVALLGLRRAEDAIASYDRANALDPNAHKPRFSRGLAKLALGRIGEAWDDFENRWQIPAVASPRPALNAPEWRGEDVAGKSVLVFAERGFGDVIHFCRYLPLLAARGADVHFLVPRKLHRLMATLPGRIRLHDALPPDAHFDFQSAVMSLPAHFHTDLATIPADVPYLAAEPARAAEWKERLGAQGFKIGISWQGASWQGGAAIKGRSFPLTALGPLACVPGVRLISLQKGEGSEQLESAPPDMRVESLGDFDSGPDAFIDTAAVMQSLDLVVSCDTAIAHLAGALARPTWVALQYAPEWRWMLAGETSPWYPTLKLFRQTRAGDWEGVFAAMAGALSTIVQPGR